MDNKILQSVVEITRHRDLDSLECSLVTTMAELVPVTEISILKIINENRLDNIEATVCLTALTDEFGERSFVWGTAPSIITIDEEVKNSITSPAISTYHNNNGVTRLLAPVTCDGKISCILSLKSDQDISHFKPLIDGFIRVYNNYIIIFNESERDKLTGLYNRRTFDNKLQRLFKTQRENDEHYLAAGNTSRRRSEAPGNFLWMVIFDIDLFKRVNDQYGHVFGDEVLLTVSQIMKSCFRHSDLKFRIGGEEFVIILEPSTLEKATQLLEDFRNKVAEHEFSQIGTVTISIGFAKITDRDYPPVILECADRALYYAKEQGRNRVYNYETLLQEGKITPPKKGGSVDLF